MLGRGRRGPCAARRATPVCRSGAYCSSHAGNNRCISGRVALWRRHSSIPPVAVRGALSSSRVRLLCCGACVPLALAMPRIMARALGRRPLRLAPR
jgi:hypothetical protein